MKKWKQRELLFDRYVINNQGGFSRRENVTYVNPDIPEEEAKYPSFTVQYTGVKDMNGVKIFEGDIVRESPKTGRIDYIIVQYGISLFGAGFTFYKSRNYEILGNVFQNPELVEKYKLEI